MTMVEDLDTTSLQEPDGSTSHWWIFLCAGTAWTLISLVILSFDPTSAATIGYLVAFVLIAGGVTELVNMGVSASWRWAHGLLGAVFLLVGLSALFTPFQTFGILALLIGWYLVIKGVFEICLAIAAHRELPLWGLMLASGIVQLAIGMWAIGYPGRSAWLLILWIGIGALMRGISEIILAFQLRPTAPAST